MPQTPVPKLVQISSDLLTDYDANKRTRNLDGSLIDEAKLQHCGPGWQASPAMADALVKLDAAMVAAGGRRLRIGSPYRSPDQQAQLRAKYDAWVAAGKPVPGTQKYIPSVMQTAFACKPGESNHGWGGAVDIDQHALEFPGFARGTDAALNMFWPIAAECGFTPIIAYPHIDQSEAWHFDHFGAMKAVRDLANAHGYGGYTVAASVGNTIFGYVPLSGKANERTLQARLLLGGTWCGPVDGDLGKMTLAALKAIGAPTKGTNLAVQALAYLDEQGYAFDQLAAL